MEAVLGIGGTLLGTFLGWYLSRRTTRDVAREERQWQEEQTLRERQEDVASRLRGELIEIQHGFSSAPAKPDEALARINKSHPRLREAWSRASLLRDESIDRTFFSLDILFFLASQDARGLRGRHRGTSIELEPVSVGFVELRKAIDCFLRREEFVPEMPEAMELSRMANAAGRGQPATQTIADYLLDHEIGL